MKLKYIEISGYAVLIDENVEIKENDYALIPSYVDIVVVGAIDDMPYSEKHRNWQGIKNDTHFDVEAVCKFKKIVFASKELNLNVPELPDWRAWEVEQEAIKYFKELEETINVPKDYFKYPSNRNLVEKWIAGYNHNKSKYTEENLRKAIEFAVNSFEEFDANSNYDKQSRKEGIKELQDIFIQSLEKVPSYIIIEDSQKCIIKEIIY